MVLRGQDVKTCLSGGGVAFFQVRKQLVLCSRMGDCSLCLGRDRLFLAFVPSLGLIFFHDENGFEKRTQGVICVRVRHDEDQTLSLFLYTIKT